MRILSLVPSQRVQGRWLLTLEDGAKLKLTDREMVDFSLYQGQEVPAAVLDQLREAAAASQARRRAANILSARPLSRAELEKRLVQKGEAPAHAAAACDELERLGYLDDGQYARTLAQYYARRGYGPRKIRDELYRRGVPRELWDQALEDLEEDGAAIDRFVASRLGRIEHPDRADVKRVSDALARRGYSWSQISAALSRYADALEEQD